MAGNSRSPSSGGPKQAWTALIVVLKPPTRADRTITLSSSYGRHRSSLNEAAQPLSRPTRPRQDGHCALVNADRAEICPVTVTKTGSGNYRYRLHDGTTGFTPLPQSAYAYSGFARDLLSLPLRRASLLSRWGLVKSPLTVPPSRGGGDRTGLATRDRAPKLKSIAPGRSRKTGGVHNFRFAHKSA